MLAFAQLRERIHHRTRRVVAQRRREIVVDGIGLFGIGIYYQQQVVTDTRTYGIDTVLIVYVGIEDRLLVRLVPPMTTSLLCPTASAGSISSPSSSAVPTA